MRQVILDTETTGMNAADGDRIIEIGCVELQGRQRTQRTWHHLVNPERDVEEGAYQVHGISRADLEDKPLFGEIVDQFIEFIKNSEVIIHNAPFDVGFINAELARLGDEWGKLEDHCKITDTLDMAKALHPGKRNGLDALCERYFVDNSQRELHGALLDAQLLGEVYLAMTSGQTDLVLSEAATAGQPGRSAQRRRRPAAASAPLKVIRPSSEETKAHQAMLALIEKASQEGCLWTRVAAGGAATGSAAADGAATNGAGAAAGDATAASDTTTGDAPAGATGATATDSTTTSGATATADGGATGAAASGATNNGEGAVASADSAAATGGAAGATAAGNADADGVATNGADTAADDAAAGDTASGATNNGEGAVASADSAATDGAAGTTATDSTTTSGATATADGGATGAAASGATNNGEGAVASADSAAATGGAAGPQTE